VERMRRKTPSSIRRVVALVVAVFALAACSNDPDVASGTDPIPAASTVSTTPPPMPDGGSCTNLSPTRIIGQGLEVRGRLRTGEPVWALFDGVDSLPSGTSIKTFWFMSGDHALQITLVGPSDRTEHGTGIRPGVAPGDWSHEGEPWQSSITFPQPGCWRIYVQRGTSDGELWVEV
jgi:hypothetical protein